MLASTDLCATLYYNLNLVFIIKSKLNAGNLCYIDKWYKDLFIARTHLQFITNTLASQEITTTTLEWRH